MIEKLRIRNLIGGEFVDSEAASSIDVLNPVRGTTLIGD